MPASPLILRSQPGVRRDGTRFDADYYNDVLWCRFQRGLPRKMRGFRSMSSSILGIPRGMWLNSRGATNYLHIGCNNYLQQVPFDADGNASPPFDRTPAGFATSNDNLWTFDLLFDPITGLYPTILAHGAPNLSSMASTTNVPLYYGNLTANTALTATSAPQTSGGVLVVHPYVFVYGNDGYVAWSAENNPNDWVGAGSGDAYITDQKIVKGMLARGGNGPMAGLFWSINALVRASYVGGTAIFQFDTITDSTSILSSQSVVEYDGIYYWIGTDRFLSYNGVVREVPNDFNFNWFFDNLNYAQRQKVFGFKNTRWGEIWWCFPYGDATECTHAIVLNLREGGIWYDTELPAPRSSAACAAEFRYPIMGGTTPNDSVLYKLWQHEIGTDWVDGSDTYPIRSYFETADFSFVGQPQGAQNKTVRVSLIEPDFIQTGDLTVTVTGNANARATIVEGSESVIPESPATPQETVNYFKEQRRLMRFRFESNVLGGDYEMGKIIAHIEPSDGTYL